MTGDDKILCSSCGEPLSMADTYCPNCSAPTISAFNLDPMNVIESEGRLLSRAAEGRQKPIVLIGIWILFLPVFLVGVFFAINILSEGGESGLGNFVFFWGAIGLAAVGFIVLYRVTKNYFQWSTQANGKEE